MSEAAVEGLVGLGELYQVTKTYADAEKVWKKLLSEFAGAASTRALEIARLMTGKTQIIHVPKRVEGRSAFFTAELYYFGGLKLEQENSIFDAMEYYKRAAEAGGDSYWRTRLAREREKALEG